MDAHRVQVLHGADCDDVAYAVPHGLKLYLFPARDASFYQDLMDRGHVQSCSCYGLELCIVVGDAATRATQREGGAYDDRVADVVGRLLGLLHCVCYFRRHHRLAYSLHGVPEKLSVLSLVYGLHVGTQKAHSVAFQYAPVRELHGQGESGLPSKPCQQRVWPLFLYYSGYSLHVKWLKVDLVGHSLVCHDGGRVGVHQHHVDALGFEHPAGLGTGVVEFGRLAYDDRS